MLTRACLLELIVRGTARTVAFAIRDSEECLGRQFFEELDAKGQAKFDALFQQMAFDGVIPNKSRFSKEQEGYSFKHEVKKVQVRFPCFNDGPIWIITHGFKKPGAQEGKGRWPEQEVRRARDIKAEYDAGKRAGIRQF